jgi:hypothetical protein
MPRLPSSIAPTRPPPRSEHPVPGQNPERVALLLVEAATRVLESEGHLNRVPLRWSSTNSRPHYRPPCHWSTFEEFPAPYETVEPQS